LRVTTTGTTAELAAIRKLVSSFSEKNPDTKAEYTAVETDYETWTLAAFASGAGPDVFGANWPLFGAWSKQGLIGDVGPALTAAKTDTVGLFPLLKNFFSEGSFVRGLPFACSPIVLYCNKRLFSGAGRALPDVSWTWEQFTETAAALFKGDTAAPTQAGFYPSGATLEWIAWVGAAAGTLFDSDLDPTRCTLDSAQAVQGVQAFADLWLKQQGATTPVNSPFGTPAQAFIAGKAAMVAGPRTWVEPFKASAGLDWDVAFLPAGSGGHATPFTTTGLCVSKTTRQNAATAKLIAFLCANKDSQVELAKLGTIVPAYRAAATGPEFQKGIAINNSVFTDAFNFAIGPFRSAIWNQLEDIWTPQLQRVWKGDATAAETLKSVTASVNDALKQASRPNPSPSPGQPSEVPAESPTPAN
jgi:ABC-type glycerol-3-phosphate transport system substrate-binding protein